MGKAARYAEQSQGWVLFFYSIPSKPVSHRIKIWRRLTKAGAIQLKGAVYILPFTAEHYEFFQWLVAEVREMNGDAALVSIARVDTMKDEEIVELFNQARRNDYLPVARDLETIGRKWDAIQKGGQGQSQKILAGQLDKIRKVFAEVRKIDFFATEEGVALLNEVEHLQAELEQWAGPGRAAGQKAAVSHKSAADYRGRTWTTRKQPFVDRMASAWLIRRFIDPQASFAFIDDHEVASLPEATVVFDMFGGEFTHSGELCTFEVLIRSFGLKDKALRQLAEIIHDLDIKDNKYQAAEALGVEGILSGIRKTAKDDNEALALGMQAFEMLYISKKP